MTNIKKYRIENYNNKIMDPKAIDAGVGEVPFHAVDTNIPGINGGYQPRHNIVTENVRNYPLVGETSNTGMRPLHSHHPPTHQQRSPPGNSSDHTHHQSSGHVVREMRDG